MGILQRHPFFCKSYGFARMQTKSGCDEQLMKHSIRKKNWRLNANEKYSNELLKKDGIRK
jgi:hypothetical protein